MTVTKTVSLHLLFLPWGQRTIVEKSTKGLPFQRSYSYPPWFYRLSQLPFFQRLTYLRRRCKSHAIPTELGCVGLGWPLGPLFQAFIKMVERIYFLAFSCWALQRCFIEVCTPPGTPRYLGCRIGRCISGTKFPDAVGISVMGRLHYGVALMWLATPLLWHCHN